MRWRILSTLLTLALLMAPLVAYHWYYEYYSLRLIHERHMYYEKANGMKHALAAAELTQVLSKIMSVEDAANLVLRLGYVNEYAEQIVRFPKDSPAEVLKDISNNEVGVTLAQWYETQPTKFTCLRELLDALSAEHILVESDAQESMSAADATLKYWAAVDAARRIFSTQQAEIEARTRSALEEIQRRASTPTASATTEKPSRASSADKP